ncbi:uncharacterized protein VTP21DRAFT_7742 [Calcarisporiella thermophila]|uniref:uncharacterized protein n=1 Tax=Calcarisporiella thermophila TaxID=911321 RepID=UPI0037433D7D
MILDSAVIVQATTRNMIYRLCRTCRGKVIKAIGEEKYYCHTCREDTTNPEPHYRLQLTLACKDELEVFMAFDRAVAGLMGCSAAKFARYLGRHPDLLDIAEERLIGLHCRVMVQETRRSKKHSQYEPDKVIDQISPLEEGFVPVADRRAMERYWETST